MVRIGVPDAVKYGTQSLKTRLIITILSVGVTFA